MDKIYPLPYKVEDEPLVITNKRPLNENEDQSIASEPQTNWDLQEGLAHLLQVTKVVQ